MRTIVSTGKTAVNITGTMGTRGITIDFIGHDTYLDGVNGAATDYATNAAIGSSYGSAFTPACYGTSALAKNLYEVSILNISLVVSSCGIDIG